MMGIIIFGSVGALALNHHAREIKYTPNHNTWNVKNVDQALTDLKENYVSEKNQITQNTNTINTLTANVNKLNSYGRCKWGSATINSNDYNINIGFRGTRFILYFSNDVGAMYTGSGKVHWIAVGYPDIQTNLSDNFEFGNTYLKIKSLSGYSINYGICK